MPMELHGYVGIQRVWAWAQVVPMDNLVDGQRVGRWVTGWIWNSSTRPKPDPLPSLTARRRSERANRRQRKAVANEQCDIVSAGGRSFFTSDDERWDDVWLSASDDTDEDDDGDGSDLE